MSRTAKCYARHTIEQKEIGKGKKRANTGSSRTLRQAQGRQRLGFDTAKDHRLLNHQPLARRGALPEMVHNGASLMDEE
jgi:hypothetical protein